MDGRCRGPTTWKIYAFGWILDDTPPGLNNAGVFDPSML